MRAINDKDIHSAVATARLNQEETALMIELAGKWIDAILDYEAEYGKRPTREVDFEKIIKATTYLMALKCDGE